MDYSRNKSDGQWGAHGRYLVRESANSSAELGLGFGRADHLQIIMAFFDLFVRSYYVHAPTVPLEAFEGAADSAKLRNENLLRQLPKVLAMESEYLRSSQIFMILRKWQAGK
jgi:hypothetical protein